MRIVAVPAELAALGPFVLRAVVRRVDVQAAVDRVERRALGILADAGVTREVSNLGVCEWSPALSRNCNPFTRRARTTAQIATITTFAEGGWSESQRPPAATAGFFFDVK